MIAKKITRSLIFLLFTLSFLCPARLLAATPRIDDFMTNSFLGSLPAARLQQGVSLGIKYNRAAREYPDAVLKDLNRFKADRIGTVMLCLSWKQWAEPDGTLKRGFVNGALAEVLAYCEKLDIPVILSVHCSFWGKKGDWTIPSGIVASPNYRSASSVLLDPELRGAYVRFLQEWYDATAQWKAVVGYNLLNEPVSATKGWLTLKREEFLARWDGVIGVVGSMRSHLAGVAPADRKVLLIGAANGDPNFAEAAYVRAGSRDLRPFWTDMVDVVSGQQVDILKKAVQWYPSRPKIRTEGFLSFAVNAARKSGSPYSWQAGGEDHAAMFYDYDAVYNYEGTENAEVSGLLAVYVWRVGSQDGSRKHLWLLDHRQKDRPTPYYYALRDLASGVDSFETYPQQYLPRDKDENLAFIPDAIPPGVSARWHGSGRILGSREPSPFSEITTMSAAMTLAPGQYMEREVISRHWPANGVTLGDRLILDIKSTAPADLSLFVKVREASFAGQVAVKGTGWEQVSLPLAKLGLSDEDLSRISSVGLKNISAQKIEILLDDFLIR